MSTECALKEQIFHAELIIEKDIHGVLMKTLKTRLKGFSPKREQRLWKIFQISGRDSKVRA